MLVDRNARRAIRVRPERPPFHCWACEEGRGLVSRSEALGRSPMAAPKPASKGGKGRSRRPFQESARRDFEPLAPNDSEG
jgi:hypothetical protein